MYAIRSYYEYKAILITKQQNLGFSDSVNIGIKRATGDVFLLCVE